MNKKFFYFLFITALAVHIDSCSYPRYLSLAAKAYAVVTRHPVFTTCKKTTTLALKAGAIYLLAHFINAHRNKNRQATIKYNPQHQTPDKTRKGKLTVITDGLVTIEGGTPEFSVATERIVLGRKSHATSWAERFQNFIEWMSLPVDRTMTRHVIHVPEHTDVTVTTRYGYTESSLPNPIAIRGISGLVEATTPHETTRYRATAKSGAMQDA